jgi:heterodisulfide reductase subunit B2
MRRIAYYPGCTLKDTARKYEESALATLRKLGWEPVEPADWNCCGVTASLTADDLMRHVAPARNLLRAQELHDANAVDDARLLTLCAMCYNTLAQTNLRLRNRPEDRASVNDFDYLSGEYRGEVEVIHLLQLLRETGFDTIRSHVAKPLAGRRPVAYYGCTLLRPKPVAIDHPESPSVMEDVLRSLGADTLEWNSAHRCCGSYHTVHDPQIVQDQVRRIVGDALRRGATEIVTCCPLCAFNLEQRQADIAAADAEFRTLPVFYITELMVEAMG